MMQERESIASSLVISPKQANRQIRPMAFSFEKTLWRAGILILISLICVCKITAQVQMSLELPRTQYVLYEPVILNLTIINNTGQEQVLKSKEKSPWLGFIVQRSDGSAISREQETEWPTINLQPGEKKSMRVNITPLFSFRETGPYDIRAVVTASGNDYISALNRFTVVNGQTIWREIKVRPGDERVFSMIRFSPSNTLTLIYVRVEDLKKNIVYATYPLGNITMLADPERFFDQENKLHVLHPIGNGVYQYSRIDYDGKLEYDAHYTSSVGGRPKLEVSDDKNILIVGGRLESKETNRVVLSETQKYIQLLKTSDKKSDTSKDDAEKKN